MSPLESRKRLLLAESELNRAQLVEDLDAMADGIHALANRARTITTFASAAASLVTGLASFRRKKAGPASEKPSWLQTILKSAGPISSIWSAFRSGRRDPSEN